jgi:hypothetical protein
MFCPVCITELRIALRRAGAVIGICPGGHGLWLGREEVDQVVAPPPAGDAGGGAGAVRPEWPAARPGGDVAGQDFRCTEFYDFG